MKTKLKDDSLPKVHRSVRTEVETITPTKAWAILENMIEDNRPISDDRINRFASHMKDGTWAMNGQPLIFDWYDRLVDGQHRVWAITRAEVPVKTNVTRGIDPEAFFTLDTGVTRYPRDVIAMMGEKHQNVMASILRWAWLWDNKKLSERGTAMEVPQNQDLVKTFESDPETFREAAKLGASRLGLPIRCFPPGVVGFSWILFSRKNQEEAQAFIDRCHTGENLTANDPAQRIRSLFMQAKERKLRMPGIKALALFIKSWNLTRKGEMSRGLTWKSDEKLPRPV